ncbi:putative hydrolase [Sphingobium sp. SYK-6]|uniref:ribonuclease J n=1 Tax=Sphingobium sp. (strain NBRC 103272 / SYK-6) TaxID=627192 RepID=UPI0002277257|nr:ribonuclease J [Sphingobium sp. SYK-6]BAK66977.1 putative hydrolase [Sphingobium sp. SYK-6]
MTPGEELLFLALGGSGEIGMNLNLYGCRGKWVMVDLGVTFADASYPGVDLIMPDTAFIEERQKDLLGIVLTHGHEDHIGAVPYLAAELGVPLYATPFTAGLIRGKLAEEGLESSVPLHVIQEGEGFELGPFGFRYVPLAHSIPEGNALLIETPFGRIFHTGDWKLDDEPQLGRPSTAEELRAIGDTGVLALVCDSTNVFNAEASGSEGSVQADLLSTVAGARGRVVVTTFASNAARLHTLANVARLTGRKLCVAGRSLDRILSVAQSCGYLNDFPPLLDFDGIMAVPPREAMIIATGGQGEPRAALARIAAGQHPISLDAGDTVIFSSRKIPGNEIAIGRIQNALAEKEVVMVTESQAHVHVSGHPGRPELAAMYEWIRPEILLPVHGEMRHMMEQARFGASEGIARTIVQKNGDVLRLAPNGPTKLTEVHASRLVLDGDVILPADGGPMSERRKLMLHGHMSVGLALSSAGKLVGVPDIRLLGVPIEEDRELFLEEARAALASTVSAKGRRSDIEALREAVRIAVRRVALEWTGKKPIVSVSIVQAG